MGEQQRTFRLSFSDGGGTVTEPVSLSLQELSELLLRHEETLCSPCTRKSCSKKKVGWAFVPAVFRGFTRKIQFVESVTMLVFDIDELPETGFIALCSRLEGVEVFIHSTHSHSPPEKHCYRLILPVTREILPSEFRTVWDYAARKYGIPFDKKAKDSARLFYLPSVSKTRVELAFSHYEPGETTDVDTLLAEAHVARKTAAKITHSTKTTNIDEARSQLEKLGSDGQEEIQELLSRVVAGEALAQEGGRDDSVNKVCSYLAWAMPDTPTDALLELLRPSVVQMPESPGEDSEFWLDKAAYCLERARARYEEQLQKDAATSARVRSLIRARQGRVENPDEAETQTSPVYETEIWETKLVLARIPKDGELPKYKNIFANVVLILENHKEWAGKLRFDEMRQEFELQSGGEHPHSRDFEAIVMDIQTWIQRSEYQIDVPKQVVEDAVVYIARDKNKYNSLTQQLLSLRGTWDGVWRVETFFTDFYGTNDTKYARIVARKWFRALMARAFEPGCQMDNVLVLEGDQGNRKSSFLRELAGVNYFVEAEHDLGSKDSLVMIASNWIVELSELASMDKTYESVLKSTITKPNDKFRPYFRKTKETHPRRSVFVGTIDRAKYLRDVSGNRRYWPIRVSHRGDIVKLRKVRTQLLAEAVEDFFAAEECPNCTSLRVRCEKHIWYLTSDEELLQKREVSMRTRVPTKSHAIEKYFVGMPKESRPRVVELNDILTNVLNLPSNLVTEKEYEQAINSLAYLGFIQYVPEDSKYASEIYFLTPEYLMERESVQVAKRRVIIHAQNTTGLPN